MTRRPHPVWLAGLLATGVGAGALAAAPPSPAPAGATRAAAPVTTTQAGAPSAAATTTSSQGCGLPRAPGAVASGAKSNPGDIGAIQLGLVPAGSASSAGPAVCVYFADFDFTYAPATSSGAQRPASAQTLRLTGAVTAGTASVLALMVGQSLASVTLTPFDRTAAPLGTYKFTSAAVVSIHHSTQLDSSSTKYELEELTFSFVTLQMFSATGVQQF